MKKFTIGEDNSPLSIRPDVIKRIVCKNDWWSTAPRVFDDRASGVFDLSYPDDYVSNRKIINEEENNLIRLSESQ
jgi:hypothetical protein